jgi:hypothetical protein
MSQGKKFDEKEFEKWMSGFNESRPETIDLAELLERFVENGEMFRHDDIDMETSLSSFAKNLEKYRGQTLSFEPEELRRVYDKVKTLEMLMKDDDGDGEDDDNAGYGGDDIDGKHKTETTLGGGDDEQSKHREHLITEFKNAVTNNESLDTVFERLSKIYLSKFDSRRTLPDINSLPLGPSVLQVIFSFVVQTLTRIAYRINAWNKPLSATNPTVAIMASAGRDSVGYGHADWCFGRSNSVRPEIDTEDDVTPSSEKLPIGTSSVLVDDLVRVMEILLP